jgi:hypothetical protein
MLARNRYRVGYDLFHKLHFYYIPRPAQSRYGSHHCDPKESEEFFKAKVGDV